MKLNIFTISHATHIVGVRPLVPIVVAVVEVHTPRIAGVAHIGATRPVIARKHNINFAFIYQSRKMSTEAFVIPHFYIGSKVAQ